MYLLLQNNSFFLRRMFVEQTPLSKPLFYSRTLQQQADREQEEWTME
jgi:hypothetical protein